ncbi:MAG: hypothetical protein IT304_03780 [Dehalococcoidia bacterium]|nr:hypothetical protein [Dehalococcoidia bacterium]
MRSSFRVLSLLAIAVVAGTLFLACGGDDSSDSGNSFPVSSDPAKNVPKDQLNKINLVVAGYDWHVGKNNFVFGITDKNDEPQGGAQAVATFYDLRDQNHPKPLFQAQAVASAPGVHAATEHVHPGGEVHVHGGEDENRVGYYATVSFDHPGFWGVVVQATLKDGTKGTTNVGFNVFDKPQMPAPGMAALKSDNLTKADVKDIKEIDSGDPPNDMHTVKIKDAIAAHRPMVIVFSTPAFCTSRFCGPVNEEVEDLQTVYRDSVDFVHVEIWRNFDKKELNPTAKEWLLRPDGGLTEPVVYVVDRNGTIYERWEGPVAKNIMEPAVKAVADGQVYAQ